MIAKTSAVAESFLNVPCRNSFLSRPTPSEELGILLLILFIMINCILYPIINIIYNLNNAPIPSQNQPFLKKNSSLTPKKLPTTKTKPLIINQIQHEKNFSLCTKKIPYRQKKRQPSQLPVSINTPFDMRVSHRTDFDVRAVRDLFQGTWETA